MLGSNRLESITDTVSEATVVEQVRHLSKHTDIKLQDGRAIVVRPFLYLHKGDRLEFVPNINQFDDIYKLVIERDTGVEKKIRVYPPYSKSEIVCVAPHCFEVVFRERTSVQDWESARLLEQFHYRGKGLNKIVGRRTVLLAESRQYGIIGYGVLAATVAAAKPRFALFNTNFKEQMTSKLINQLVRIPRIVVHPEFRGLGLGALIAKHLVQYATEYWDIQGYTPIAVEVIASMTEYHHFFEKAGFIKAGYTLGYKNGIIPEYGKGSWEPRLNYRSYDFLENQKAKPYLIYPINEKVNKMIQEKNFIPSLRRRPLYRMTQPIEPINFANVSITYRTHNGLTSRAQEVKEAFDVDASQMSSPVVRDFSLTICPGDVVLLTGASGSGKSTIAKILSQPLGDTASIMDINGEISGICHGKVATLNPYWDENLPLIDQVGKSAKEAIFLLNGVGLAEAHLYLKQPRQISDGQRYRFSVARLCSSGKPLWVADDFACSLDPLTAAVVAKGLRKMLAKFGATLVVAAPHVEYFLGSLLPNKKVVLRWGDYAKIYSINMSYGCEDDGLKIELLNTGIEQLSNIALMGLGETGVLEELQAVTNLSRGERSINMTVPCKHLRKYGAIVTTTEQGVGDIVYIGVDSGAA